MASAGFTLIELLVTLVLASIVILIFYAFVTVASNATWTQADAMRASERMDMVMSNVMADIRTAGHLGVPNFGLNPDDYRPELVICASTLNTGGVAPPIALEISDSALDARAFAPTPTDLQLFGAFEVQEPLLVTGVGSGAIQVVLPQSFIPNFAVLSDSGQWREAARERWYQALLGSAVLVTNRRGGALLLPVSGNLASPQLFVPESGTGEIPIQPGAFELAALQARTGGGERARSETCLFTPSMLEGEGVSVHVLQRVRYRRITAREAGFVAQSGDPISDPDRPVLVREFIRTTAPLVPGANDRLRATLVAQNVTDFQVFVDGVPAASIGPEGAITTIDRNWGSSSPWAPGIVGSNVGAASRGLLTRAGTGSCAHFARHVYVQVSTAFDRAIPGLEMGNQLLRSVVPARWADASPTSFTRVLTSRGEVSLSNFAYADLRGGGGC